MGDSLISPVEAAEVPLPPFLASLAAGPGMGLGQWMLGAWTLGVEQVRQAPGTQGYLRPLVLVAAQQEEPHHVPGEEEGLWLSAEATSASLCSWSRTQHEAHSSTRRSAQRWRRPVSTAWFGTWFLTA